MKKKILPILIVLVGVTLRGFAQDTDDSRFSIGIDGGLPVGYTKSIADYFTGGSIRYERSVADKTFFTVSAGYIYMQYINDLKAQLTTAGIDQSGESFVPLKIGAKYFVNSIFYGEGQIGVAISTGSSGSTAFAYAPGIGLLLGKKVDIGVRYEGWSDNDTLGQFAVRLAYCFK